MFINKSGTWVKFRFLNFKPEPNPNYTEHKMQAGVKPKLKQPIPKFHFWSVPVLSALV